MYTVMVFNYNQNHLPSINQYSPWVYKKLKGKTENLQKSERENH